MKFKEVDHKFWISDLQVYDIQLFSIGTDFQNLYLPKNERSKIREYGLYSRDFETLIGTYPTFAKAKKQAEKLLKTLNKWVLKLHPRLQRYGYHNPLLNQWIFDYWPTDERNKRFWATADKDGFYDGADGFERLKDAKKHLQIENVKL